MVFTLASHLLLSFNQVYEIPDGVDMDQESDVEVIDNDEPGYNESRSREVKDLLKYYYPPVVSFVFFFFFLWV